jgi:hypothetical protein
MQTNTIVYTSNNTGEGIGLDNTKNMSATNTEKTHLIVNLRFRVGKKEL